MGHNFFETSSVWFRFYLVFSGEERGDTRMSTESKYIFRAQVGGVTLNSDSGCKEWKTNCLKRIVKKGDAVWKWSKGQGMEGTNKSILWRDKGIPECIVLEKNGSSEKRVLLLTKLKKIFDRVFEERRKYLERGRSGLEDSNKKSWGRVRKHNEQWKLVRILACCERF